jgi:phosphohistidine swiveling domain-containing protein
MRKQSDIMWEIFWEIPECPPFLTSEPARVFTRGLEEFCGENFDDCILEYRDNTNYWYLDGETWSKLDKILLERMLVDVEWAKEINIIAKKYCYPCWDMLDGVRRADYKNMVDKELLDAYQRFFEVYTPAHGSGHPANLLEMKNQRLSGYLKKYLKERIEKVGSTKSPDETFVTLITPTKDMSPQKEAKSLYELLDTTNNDKKLSEMLLSETSADELLSQFETSFPDFLGGLKKHEVDWSWTVYNWEGPPNTLESYIENLRSLVRQKEKGSKKIREINDESDQIENDQKSIKEELDIDRKHRDLLTIASDIMFLKGLRKDCMYKGAWACEPMFREIANRLGLSLHESRFVFFFEMEEALLNKKVDPKTIKERTKQVVLHQKSNEKDNILEGDEASDFINSLDVKNLDEDIDEIKGQVAYSGKAKGRIKYINTPDMMDKMEEGDILLAYVTQPNLLPAMKKAAAFITDFGGITCHAAIVAREWKVPCVIGTGNATKILKDGDLVEVDAVNGIVKIIEKA